MALDPSIDPDQPAFIRVPVRVLGLITKTLTDAGEESVARRVAEFAHDYIDPEANAERQKWIDLADKQVAKDGAVEIDSDSTISHSEDNGQYVLAWVWVDGPMPDEDD